MIRPATPAVLVQRSIPLRDPVGRIQDCHVKKTLRHQKTRIGDRTLPAQPDGGRETATVLHGHVNAHLPKGAGLRLGLRIMIKTRGPP